MFNLTKVELNMCVSIIFGFISKIMALIVTSAIKVSYLAWLGKFFVMTHMLLEYNIKVKKFGGAFKVISPIPMHCYNGMLDSDLKESKDKKTILQ